MYKFIFNYILLVLLLTFSVKGQDRLEFQINPGEPRPEIIPVNDIGFIKFNPLKIFKENGSRITSLTFYDTSFEMLWEKEIEFDKKLELTFYDYVESGFVLIYSHGRQEKIQIFRIRPTDGEIEKHEFSVVKNFLLTDFEIKNNLVFLAGKIKNIPLIQKLDLISHKTVTLPSMVGAKRPVVTDLMLDKRTGQVSAAITGSLGRRSMMIIRTFDDNGSTYEDLTIRSDQNIEFKTAKVSTLDDQVKLVMGSYGFRKSDDTQGFYMAKFVNDEPRFLKEYSFTDLDNFFTFLNDKKQDRMESKVEKKKKKGKDLKINYRLLMHDVEQQGDQYVLIGEAYYEVYKRLNYNFGYYQPYYGYQNNEVFDGNQFTHAVAAGFSKDGDLLWDHSFKITDIKTMNLKEKVKSYIGNKEITLFYNQDGLMKKLTIKDEKVVSDPAMAVTLESAFEEDKVTRTDDGYAEYWYDNYFIAWGYQKIKNTANEDIKKRRNVFYINKLSFDNF